MGEDPVRKKWGWGVDREKNLDSITLADRDTTQSRDDDPAGVDSPEGGSLRPNPSAGRGLFDNPVDRGS